MNIAMPIDRLAQARQFLRFGAKVSGLITGLAIGQGSLFAVQTWLVAEGKLHVVASFGFAIALLSLVQWVADWGGLVLLSRHAISGRDFRGVWAANGARLIVSVFTIIVLTGFAAHYQLTDPFAAGILFGGVAIAPVWALNLSGFLDGHGRSAYSGPLAGLPWVAASITIALIFLYADFSFSTGLLIGGAYTVGCIVCVALQYLLVRDIVRFGDPRRLTRAETMNYFAQGGMYCFAEFPKELYGRALIMIVSTTLGPQITGIYIYVRQLLSGFAQVLGVIKRVEFMNLAAALRKTPLRLRRVVKAQWVNIGAAVAVSIAALGIFLLRNHLSTQFAEVSYYFVFFAATLPFWALSTCFGQILILQHRMKIYSCVMLGSLAVGALLTTQLTGVLGITFIAGCDIAMNLAQIALFARLAKRS
jgi:hypothetical protein